MLKRQGPRDELTFYAEEARSTRRHDEIHSAVAACQSAGAWGSQPEVWFDNLYDSVAQGIVYRHLAPNIPGQVVLQLGGTGKESLKAIVGGAASALLVTPVEEEAELPRTVARELGLDDRFEARIGVGEALPLDDNSVDAVIAEGCLHHTEVDAALREVHRVLRPGGRFGAWDPWHARLYDVGTAVFGKREEGIMCRPLDPERMATLQQVFPASSMTLHGAVTRYPVIALGKLGYQPSWRTINRMVTRDDKIARSIPFLSRNGSCAAIVAEKV